MTNTTDKLKLQAADIVAGAIEAGKIPDPQFAVSLDKMVANISSIVARLDDERNKAIISLAESQRNLSLWKTSKAQIEKRLPRNKMLLDAIRTSLKIDSEPQYTWVHPSNGRAGDVKLTLANGEQGTVSSLLSSYLSSNNYVVHIYPLYAQISRDQDELPEIEKQTPVAEGEVERFTRTIESLTGRIQKYEAQIEKLVLASVRQFGIED